MENQPKLNSVKEIIAFLAERFPLCFTTEGEARPLKIGIFKDLVERVQENDNLSKTQLRSALRMYTSSWRYLYGVKLGAQRVDLDGNACGELEQEHIDHAKQKLQEAKARVQAVRAEKNAKREPATRENHKSANGERQQRSGTESKKAPVAQRNNTNATGQQNSKPRSSAMSNKPRPVRVVKKENAPRTKAVIVDVSKLHIGQQVKVKAGKSVVDATVLEIIKNNVRVQLTSGLAMIIRAEHLQF